MSKIVEDIDINVNWYQIQTEIRKQVYKLLTPFQNQLLAFQHKASVEYAKMEHDHKRLGVIEAHSMLDLKEENQL